MVFSFLATLSLGLLIAGAVAWTHGGNKKSSRERGVGTTLIALASLLLLGLMGFIYILGRIL
jgi:hypothetical protein